MTIRVKPAPVNDFTSNVCGETAGSLHYISGITPERAKQVLNIKAAGIRRLHIIWGMIIFEERPTNESGCCELVGLFFENDA